MHAFTVPLHAFALRLAAIDSSVARVRASPGSDRFIRCTRSRFGWQGQSLERHTTVYDVKAWLSGAMRNSCRHYLRDRKREAPLGPEYDETDRSGGAGGAGAPRREVPRDAARLLFDHGLATLEWAEVRLAAAPRSVSRPAAVARRRHSSHRPTTCE